MNIEEYREDVFGYLLRMGVKKENVSESRLRLIDNFHVENQLASNAALTIYRLINMGIEIEE